MAENNADNTTADKINKFNAEQFARLRRLVLSDLNHPENNYKRDSILFAKYDKDRIISFLQNPYRYEKELRNLSRYLYINSPHYRQLILYFANMLTLDYWVTPYGNDVTAIKVETFRKQYNDLLAKLENLNIKHEFGKILRIVMREDIYYGYEIEDKSSHFIKTLDPSFCQVSSIQDGVRNFSFDFSFFDSNTKYFEYFPQEFQTMYQIYRKDRTGKRWQELNPNKTICLKFNEDLAYNIPPFASIIISIFDLNDARLREQLKHKMENYKLLVQHIEMSEPDKPMIGWDRAVTFYQAAKKQVPDEIGLILSPMPIDSIDLDRKNGSDGSITSLAAQAEQNFYSDAGVSDFLFNNTNATSTGVASSVIVDEQMMFTFLRQIERWLNRKIKNISGKYQFRAEFLNTTHHNKDDVRKSLLEDAQNGLPKAPLAAACGYSPSSLSNELFLENEILGLTNKLIPLQSSHTQSSDQTGRPPKDTGDLTPSGEKTRDQDGNIRNN